MRMAGYDYVDIISNDKCDGVVLIFVPSELNSILLSSIVNPWMPTLVWHIFEIVTLHVILQTASQGRRIPNCLLLSVNGL